MVNQALPCEHVWKEISNYLEGDVEGALRVKMDEHFHTCERCSSVLAGMRNVVALYGDERMMELPAGFSQRLEARIEQKLDATPEKQRPPRRVSIAPRRWSTASAWMLPVGAMALFACAVGLAEHGTSRNFPKSMMADSGRNIPPNLLVVVSEGTKVFHVAGCDFIHDKATERTITAKQAEDDGFTPCTRCMRKYLISSAALTERSVVNDDRAEAEEEREELGERFGR